MSGLSLRPRKVELVQPLPELVTGLTRLSDVVRLRRVGGRCRIDPVPRVELVATLEPLAALMAMGLADNRSARC